MDEIDRPPRDQIDAVVGAIAPVLVRLRDELDDRIAAIETEFAERMAEAATLMRAAVDAYRDRADDAMRQSADIVRQLAEQVAADSRAMPDRLMHHVSLIPRPRDGRDGYLSAADDFQAGRIYEPGECCFFFSGTWQAVVRTNTAPDPEDRSWRCIAAGVAEFIATQDGDNPRTITWGNRLSTGALHQTVVPLPVPLHRGGYNSGAVYTLNDMVALDGNTWICVTESATTSPPSEQWRLVAQRGGRGKQGERGAQGEHGEPGPQGREGATGPRGLRGDRGEPAPRIASVEVIEPGIIQLQYEDATESVPIAVGSMRYVGIYEPGATYQQGDIVRLGFHLWIAQRETESVPQAISQDWSLFLPGQEPGPSGGKMEITLPLQFQGTWQVAPNIPDLLASTWSAGDYFICETADPLVPEQADPAIPGIGGQMIDHGAWIVWSDVQSAWLHLSNPAAGIPEAPIDGLTHGRKDGAWSPAAPRTSIGPVPPVNPEIGQLWWRNDPDGTLYIRYNDGVSEQWVTASPSVGASGLVHIGPTPPANPEDGQLWWRNDPDGDLYIYYTDATSSQWVSATPPGGGGLTQPEADMLYVAKAGDTMTGPLRFTDIPGPAEAIVITRSLLRLDSSDIRVNNGRIGANDYVCWEDGGGYFFGQTIGINDGGLYKRINDGLVLRQSSGDQRPQIESNNGNERWEIIDARGGTLHHAGSANVGGRPLNWTDDGAAPDLARIYGSRATNSDSMGAFVVQVHDGLAWQTALRTRQRVADPLPRIELVAEPVEPQDAVTKLYVDTIAGAIDALVPIGMLPPPNPQPGQLWWRDDPDADGYIWYDDGASQQWVPFSRPSGGGGPPIDMTDYVLKAGDTMAGDLVLPAGVPPTLQSAVNREWVEGLASGSLYAGPWQVAANVPDLLTTAHVRGTRYLCLTVDPAVPEIANAAIPGIGGRTITDGSFILWDEPLQQWSLIAAQIGGGISQEQADLRYLRLVGGTVSGRINFPGGNLSGTIDTNAAMTISNGDTAGPTFRVRQNAGNSFAGVRISALEILGHQGFRVAGWGGMQGTNGANATRAGQAICYRNHETFGWQECFRTQDVGGTGSTPGLWVSGGVEANAFVQRSDRTLKSDITPVDAAEANAAFDALRPMRYRMIGDSTDRLCWGMIADEVADAIPDAVTINDDGLKAYDVAQVLSVIVAELQAVKAELAAVKGRLP